VGKIQPNRASVSILVAAAVAALGGCFFTPRANAALILNLNNGAVIVPDNSGADTDPAVGRITNTSTVAGFGVAVSIAQSTSPGSSSAGIVSISSLQIANLNTARATLTITTSDTNFTSPGGAASPMSLDSDIGATFAASSAVGDSLTFRSFADPANAQPAAAASTALLTFTKANVGATESFNGSNQASFTRGAGAYSLANTATVSLSPGAQLNLSGITTATLVPEPASLAVLGVLASAFVTRRRATR